MTTALFFPGCAPPHFAPLPPGPVAGVDEAGRGPWAGPVVAAAVILPAGPGPDGLNDSKKLSPARRETLFAALQHTAQIGVGVASVAEIEQHNVLAATFLAMTRALAALPVPPVTALIDGNRLPPDLACPARALIKGDGLSPPIAAASIIAKVTRDRMMSALARTHPGYGWERNMGYGTREHGEALARLGVTPHHRRGFKPVRALIDRRETGG